MESVEPPWDECHHASTKNAHRVVELCLGVATALSIISPIASCTASYLRGGTALSWANTPLSHSLDTCVQARRPGWLANQFRLSSCSSGIEAQIVMLHKSATIVSKL